MLKFKILVAISDLPANQQSQSGPAQLVWIWFSNSQDLRSSAKGQLISKCLFGVFNFFQKTNEKNVT